MKKRIIFSAFAILLLCVNVYANRAASKEVAKPGLKLIAVSKTNNGALESPTTMYIGQSELVLEAKQGKNSVTITFDAAQNVITLIDHQKKQYSVFREKELKEISEQLQSMIGFAKAFYDNMPEAQKEKLAPLVNGKPKNVVYKASAQNVSVNKWKTTEYKATHGGGKPLFDTNIASFNTLGIQANDISSIKKLAFLLDKYLAGIEGLIPGASVFANLAGDQNPMFNKGIPVKTISYNTKGKASDELIVTKAEKVSFSLSDFKAPSGYKQTSFQIQNPIGK